MRRFAHDNGLSLVFGALFLVTLVGQSFAGQHELNAERADHAAGALSWWSYVTSPDFGGAVMENWQSEFLQFALFILATVWLVQRGSSESSTLDEVGRESAKEQKIGRYTPPGGPRLARFDDLRTRVYEHSLLLAMVLIFFATWLAQSINGWRVFNEDAATHGSAAIGWTAYLVNPDFWEATLQNWQSEFLAVGTMTVFTIYLRERGSAESKPVGAPHSETASSG